MRKKRLKIKWKNIVMLIILLICVYVVGHDLFMLTIYSCVNNVSCGWTWFGFLTFLLSFFVGGEIIEYITEEIKQ